jgi:hypothetical protein
MIIRFPSQLVHARSSSFQELLLKINVHSLTRFSSVGTWWLRELAGTAPLPVTIKVRSSVTFNSSRIRISSTYRPGLCGTPRGVGGIEE